METKPGDTVGLAETSIKAMVSQAQRDHTLETNTPQPVEDMPDPEEDDLDDLDDMLDAFSPTKDESANKGPATATATKPVQATEGASLEGEMADDDFAKQLQAGMADLLGELGTDADMKAQFESMLKELGSDPSLGGVPDMQSNTSSSAPETKAGPAYVAGEESFQETIQKTMERIQASEGKATAAAAATAEDDSEDILAELMKQMSSGALGGEGSEEDFSKMLLGMMEQLTNKEILYEPMKELKDKFPSWMETNKAATPKEDLKRYEEQQAVVMEIVAKFEEKTYSDDNAADREYIVERMQKMQAAGSPPPDLVGDMATAQEALAGPEEGCPQQ